MRTFFKWIFKFKFKWNFKSIQFVFYDWLDAPVIDACVNMMKCFRKRVTRGIWYLISIHNTHIFIYLQSRVLGCVSMGMNWSLYVGFVVVSFISNFKYILLTCTAAFSKYFKCLNREIIVLLLKRHHSYFGLLFYGSWK